MKVIYCKPLFATTLFRDLSEMNWFAPTNFRNQELYTSGFFFTTICQKYLRLWALVRHAKIFRTRIKVVLQYDFNIVSINTGVWFWYDTGMPLIHVINPLAKLIRYLLQLQVWSHHSRTPLILINRWQVGSGICFLYLKYHLCSSAFWKLFAILLCF